MIKRRRRVKQSDTLEQRLAEDTKLIREKARHLPPGKEREELLRRARQNDVAIHMTEWLTSSGLRAPT
jgi:hypothetical protein